MADLHVVVGLGATGLSCIHYLKRQGIPVAVTDTREDPPHLTALKTAYPDVPVALGGLSQSLLDQAARIVLSPGIALREPIIAEQVKRGVPIVGDVELFAEVVKAPVIAITGTNAKSTVTTLVGKMAEAAGHKVQTGGNLGTPALDLYLTDPQAELFVLELSSFQLETTYTLAPQVATILNISPDHMDRYDDLTEYQQAKLRIYQLAKRAVCNRDDPLTECAKKTAEKFYFTLGQPGQHDFGLVEKQGEIYLAQGNQVLLSSKELPVPGKHYQANALAALAIGHAYGLPLASMLAVLREFKGLPHRCQLVRERKGVKWYNDSKGTNVGATQAAIAGIGSEIKGKLVLIAGGVGKNADFSALVPTIQEYSRHVVLIGEAALDIAQALGNRVSISFAQTMEEAVKQSDDAALPDDCVLLSPACASFDMFKNYAHRGDVFTKVVEDL